MFDFIGKLFDTQDFPPRWHCGNWSEGLGWLHILSDLAIFGAYTAIPLVIAYFVIRRKDVPFPRIFWLFVIFIFACGTTHLIEAIIFWHPIYRFAGTVKFATAVASWSTVFSLAFVMPEAIKLPGLAKLNSELSREVDERKLSELALRESEKRLRENEASERSARAEAERASRLKDEFLSIVSHELRTPLSAILGYAQLMRAEHGSHFDQQESLTAIERNCRAQVQLIDDLLDMSRIIAGKIRLDVRTVHLPDAIDAALEMIRPAADARGIRLQKVLDPRSAPVLGDFDRLQQVFSNLLSNAVKFTPKGGRVQIALERVNSHLEISVADTGEGMDPEFLPLVFDRFRQADSGTTRRHGGLGLGLAIVKQIVELHGGSVRAKSPGPGKGSTFVVSLPLQVLPLNEADRIHPQAGSSDDGESGVSVDLSGTRILIVDDEPDARSIVSRLLEARNAQVVTASSADEALELLKTFQPTVLLSDIGMPIKDGYQLIREVRGLPAAEGGSVPAVALTAFARTEDRRRALLAGYQSHLAKPIDAGELIAVVAMLIGRRAE